MKSPRRNINGYNIAISHHGQRTTLSCLWGNMAYEATIIRAGETPICDNCTLQVHPVDAYF